ncbi:hypothetical protein D9M70_595790 [compost metagenome]
MPHPRFDRGLDHPDAVLLVPGHVLIQVVLLNDIGVLQGFAGEVVVVIRNDHFLLADQFEIEPVGHAIEHLITINRRQAIAIELGSVIPTSGARRTRR